MELWLDIFQLATYSSSSTTIKPLDPFATRCASTRNTINTVNTPALALQTKLALIAVCKSWRCLASPVLYQHIVVRSPRRANLILRTLEESRLSEQSQPSLRHGQLVRHVEVFTHSRGCTGLKYLQTVFAILRHCPNLRSLSGTWNHPVPPAFLNAVATLYGPSLEELYWNETTDKLDRQQYRFPTSATLDFLAPFKSLTTLDLRHFKLKDSFPGTQEAIRRPNLPSVRNLVISTNPWSVITANSLLLPGLRSLTIKTGGRIPEVVCDCHFSQLVRLHGSSLELVDILPPAPDESGRMAQRIQPAAFLRPDACPNLISISFPTCSSPLLEGHPSLRRIGLRGAKSETLYPDRLGDAKEHLNAILSSGRFPALELVQTIGFFVETETDCLITDVFIWWTEHFAKEGMNLLDGEGFLWEYEDSDPMALDLEKAEAELRERERAVSTASVSGFKGSTSLEGKKREAAKKQKVEGIQDALS